MADIIYKGANCFEIKTKKASLIIDPFGKDYGKPPSIKDKIVVLTRASEGLDTTGAKFVISNPGEYEIDMISVTGVPAKSMLDASDTDTVYRFSIGDVSIGVIGGIEPKLSDEQLEALGLIDYLIIPVGGHGLCPDAVGAASLVRDIEPKVLIPSHYQTSEITYPVPQDTIEQFGKELGKEITIETKLKLTRSDLPEELRIIGLSVS